MDARIRKEEQRIPPTADAVGFHALDFMTEIRFPADYEYIESYIPPRCRKPRERVVHGVGEATVPCVAAEEAPIAIKHRSCWFPKNAVYRLWNGHLYTRVAQNLSYCTTDSKWLTVRQMKDRFIRPRFPMYMRKGSEEESLEALAKEVGDYLIINGNQVWKVTGEPRYVIVTFGLGNNHASTALMIENAYNPNISGDRYFSALDYKAAVKEAVRVATARGDTDSVPRIKRAWKINVMIPEAVHCDPRSEAGPGNDFINQAEELIETLKDPVVSGLMIMATSLK